MTVLDPCLLIAFLVTAGQPPLATSQDDSQAKRAQELVLELGSDDIAVREKAARELRKIGKPAVTALTKAQESSDPEVKRRAKEILDGLRVLKLDDQGRVLVERDDKGWNVEYTRDEFGYVIKKCWVNPDNRKEILVRTYMVESDTGRLVQETDAVGRRKLIHYRGDGTVAKTQLTDGFVEEADQVDKMLPPTPKKASSLEDSYGK